MKNLANPAQIALPTIPPIATIKNRQEIRNAYQIDNRTSTTARLDLEREYHSLLMPTEKFNRKLVSYQANKSARFHNWLKYKEGFSAQLVELLLDEFGISKNAKILDPFAGSATTLLVAQEIGLGATGIEVLPMCHLAWHVKSMYRKYDLNELVQILNWIKRTQPHKNESGFRHIAITTSAFPADQELYLNWYIDQFAKFDASAEARLLLKFILMSILEDISYTRKDGQYLRWDSRSQKAQQRDERRIRQGKSSFKEFSKGKILDVQTALLNAFDHIIADLNSLNESHVDSVCQELIKDTTLQVLPRIAANQFDATITSPPYCNRYDYTRTYALELAFLGVDEEGIKRLRQQLLSCTVESRSKLGQLQNDYTLMNRTKDWEHVVQVINENAALQEVFAALKMRGDLGELNNRGVITMVEGYFTELAFVIFELHRASKVGAHVAVVNDNVRYGGEMIPVDLLMTDLASKFGFEPERIYVLPQSKGNSSQQMGKYGREANRKSITVWKKNN